MKNLLKTRLLKNAWGLREHLLIECEVDHLEVVDKLIEEIEELDGLEGSLFRDYKQEFVRIAGATGYAWR